MRERLFLTKNELLGMPKLKFLGGLGRLEIEMKLIKNGGWRILKGRSTGISLVYSPHVWG